jgi:hypothetical protein
MTEVQPITKESQVYPGERVPCVCGCGKVAVLKKKPNKDGTYHVRGCAPCRACVGGRSSRSGKKAQRAFQKEAHIPSHRFVGSNGHEENWPGPFRWEVKSGGQVRPAVTAYLRQRVQAEQNRPVGDARPFAAGMTYSGTSVVVVSASDWAAHVAPLLGEAQ